MTATRWTEEHDRLLSAAAPDVGVSAEDVERGWHRVAPRLSARPSRRRRRIAAATVIAAVVLGTSGLAVADHYSAHTGRGPLDAEDLRLGGPGERLDPGAADYGAVVAQETADIPFPDAASRRFAVQDQVHDARFAVPGKESVASGAVRAWVADAALCAWSNQWAAATRDGDAAARAEAIRMIHQAPTWPAVTDLDPHPYLRWETVESVDENGKRTVEKLRDDSQFYYLAELGRAVEGTRPAVVAAVLAANNGYCRPSLVPDLPAADPLFGER
jgi:phage tail protein X